LQLVSTSFTHCLFNLLWCDTNAHERWLNLHKTNAVNEELVIRLSNGREVQGGFRYTDCSYHSNSLSNKMDNSLLAVRDINHKSIVVGGFSHRQEKITERAGHCPHRRPRYPVCGRLPGAVHRQLRPLEAGRRLPRRRHIPPASLSFLSYLFTCGDPSAIRDLRDLYLYRASGSAAAPGHADRIQRRRGI